ncbi:MAG: 16S rRNA (cytosine(1402)-N(4))-methyltransferase [Clostridia bacterium]|nr:16S rRNA (cytosine(1402)-N(4))-methyltransferase [Clostridia bacterium]
MDYSHYSVLLDECIENLNIKPGGIYVDATLGMGGHSYEIASRLVDGRLIAIDRDTKALERSLNRLEPFMDRITLVHGNFRDMDAILNDLKIDRVDGMLFDLGVSSPQLDETERGFSYMADAPLDMRMDQSDTVTASDIVNTWDKERIKLVIDFAGKLKHPSVIFSSTITEFNFYIRGSNKSFASLSGFPSTLVDIYFGIRFSYLLSKSY